MNNLQLATTLVAPTGTGLLYIPKTQGENIAEWVNGVGDGRSAIRMNRTLAKPTLTYPGVDRMSMKRTIYHTINGVEYPLIVDIVTSIPVPITLAQRTAAFTQGALWARDPWVQYAFENSALPT